MNWAELFLLLIGAATALSFAVVGCLWCISYVLEWFEKTDWRSFAAGREDGKEVVLNRFRADAWWFSESPETTQLISELANGVNVSEAREHWRKARAAERTENEIAN
jgi:hypothetical protein